MPRDGAHLSLRVRTGSLAILIMRLLSVSLALRRVVGVVAPVALLLVAAVVAVALTLALALAVIVVA